MPTRPSPPTQPWRRVIALLAVGSAIAVGLVLAPAPVLAESVQSRTRTEAITLGTTAADPGALRTADAPIAPTGRSSTQRGTQPFVAIGVTVDVTPSGPVRVRARGDGGWSAWFELDFDAADQPDPGVERTNPGVHSAPVWVGSSDAYELDAPADLQRVQVHLVEEVRTTKVASTTAGAAEGPAINPRSAWGARPPTSHPVTTQDLRLAVVHHSVTANGYSQAEVPGILRSIQAYHQDVQGWDDIAYNFAVDRFGGAWEGRAGGIDQIVLGGHSRGFNTGTVGVVVLGDYTSTAVPSATVETVAKVIAWKFAIHRVDPATTVPYTTLGSDKYAAGTTVVLPRVVGHRDVQATSCPGGLLYAALPTIRARVAALVSTYQQGATPVLLDGDHNGDGLTDPFEYRAGPSSDVRWQASGSGTLSKTTMSVSGAYRPVAGDFDGDGRDDIFWHGTGSADDWIWWSGASGFQSTASGVGGSYAPVAGDFDGDGRDDIYWYSAGPGADYVWYFDSGRKATSRATPQDLVTGRPLVGDFTGDGRDDIFWYGPGPDADDALWTSTGRAFTSTSRPVNGFYEPAVVDGNADGRDDVVWVQLGATTSYRWDFAANGTYTNRSFVTAAPAGRPVTGDFDGDGKGDLFLYAAGSAPDAFWHSTTSGVHEQAAPVNGTYGLATGPMHLSGTTVTADLLFVSTGADYFWRTNANRTFVTSGVG